MKCLVEIALFIWPCFPTKHWKCCNPKTHVCPQTYHGRTPPAPTGPPENKANQSNNSIHQEVSPGGQTELENEPLFHCSADPNHFPMPKAAPSRGKDRSVKSVSTARQQPAASQQQTTSNHSRTARGVGWAFRTRSKNLEEMKLY